MTAFALRASCLSVPRGHLRLSSVAARLTGVLGVETFARLLDELSPAVAGRLRAGGAGPYEYTLALVRAISKLFPLDDYGLDSIWNNAYEMDDEEAGQPDYDPDQRAVRDLLFIGIPFEAYGFNLGVYEKLSPAIDLLCLATAWESSEWGDNFVRGSIVSFTQSVAAHGVVPPGRPVDPGRIRPPRGRAWTGVWGAVPDALRWVGASTGYAFLDGDSETAWEYGLPSWNIEEIRSLERQWRTAGPMWKRIRALIDHVDADPDARLPVLRGILCGDEASLRQATRPRRGASRRGASCRGAS